MLKSHQVAPSDDAPVPTVLKAVKNEELTEVMIPPPTPLLRPVDLQNNNYRCRREVHTIYPRPPAHNYRPAELSIL